MFLHTEVVVQVDVLTAEKDGAKLPRLDGLVSGQVVLDAGALPPGHLLHWPHPGDADNTQDESVSSSNLTWLKSKLY